MRCTLQRLLATLVTAFLLCASVSAQGFSFNCTRDTTIPGCSPNPCFTLRSLLPDLRGVSTTYSVNPISNVNGGSCFPVYNNPSDPGNPTSLLIDDRYSQIISIGFNFPFFGTYYPTLIASTNGVVSFDISKAGQFAHWNIISGGLPQNLPTTFYDKAIIMGVYHDLNPQGTTPPNTRIEYTTVGAAPHRKWVLSFYRVPLFNCTGLTENTHQIILYESTGIIEVLVFSKQSCVGWNQGRAMIGIQDFSRTQFQMAPGRRATDAPWGTVGMNEGWRFVPSSGASLFKRVELYDQGGTLIATGTTVNLGNGNLQAEFPNLCPPAGTTTYIVKSVYQKEDDPTVEIFGSDTVRVTKGVPGSLGATYTSTPSGCGPPAGSITVNVPPNAGSPPFQYSINAGPTQAGNVFSGLAPNTYTVNVTDVSGCSSTLTATVQFAGTPLVTTANKTDVLCNGTTTGTITVVPPTTGAPPYEYSLDGITWQTSNIFSGLAAGTYTVRFRGSNGCQGQLSVTITEPTTLSFTRNIVPVICNGQSNGTITINPGGGTSPYQYSINGVNWQSSNTFNVPAGTYTVTVRDNNLCTSSQTITVTEPTALTATAVTTNASCNGGPDGTITVTATGGNGNFQYALNGGTYQSSNIFNVVGGNYTIDVRDNLGCTYTLTNQVVGLNNDLTYTTPVNPTICEGTSANLQVNSNALQYSWVPSTGLSSATIANPVANPTTTTNYTVTLTLGGCSVDVPVTVNVNAAPIPDAGAPGFICFGQTYQLQGSGGTQYLWSPSTFLDNNSISNPVSSPDYTITYTLSVIDANGCQSLITDDITIDVTPPITVYTFPVDTIVYSGDQFQILATSIATDYLWTPSVGLSNPNIANPIVTAGPVGDSVTYKITASTFAGCKGVGYVKVRVYKGPDIYMPTGFTPNGDGKNDIFKPFTVGVDHLNYFKVFNRWGQELYTTKTLGAGWDGRLGGLPQTSGVYVWMVEGVTRDGRVVRKRGTVALIR
jgi:gliding motility-associated-like protein